MTKAETRCEWLTDKYILGLLTLFPLFTGFHGYANLTAAKFWLYTGMTAVWALGLLLCFCTGARLFAKKPGAFFYLISYVRVPRLESRFCGGQPLAGENASRRGAV